MSLYERVDQVNESLTDSQRQIAAYLLSNNHKAAFSNAAEIAAQVGVSESTVVRFARALGFRGFPDMQGFLREALLESLSPPQRLQLTDSDLSGQSANFTQELESNNLQYSLDNLDPELLSNIASRLWNARRRYVVGMRSSRGPAIILSHFLTKFMPNTVTVTSSDQLFESLQWLEKDDVVLAFSFPRYSMPTIQALRHAKQVGATTVVITDSQLAPPVQFADFQLIAPASSTFFGNSFVSAVAVSNMLVTQCVRLESKRALENLERAESVVPSHESFYGKGKSADVLEQVGKSNSGRKE